MKNKKLILSVIIFSTLLTTFSLYFFQIFFSPNFLINSPEKNIYIYESTSFKNLQDTLDQKGYINDLVSFSFLSKIMKYNNNIKSGSYVIESNMSNYDLIQKLRSGNQSPLKITFNNIRNLDELSKKITKKLKIDSDDFIDYLYSREWQNKISQFKLENVILMFLPDTYEVYWNISSKSLFQKMKYEYDYFWNDTRKAKAKKINLSEIQVGILASIVQAETNHIDEASDIAGVYINRLNKKMYLQADPTLVFAHNDFSIKRVLNVHKKINSPYNTYKNKGLPPGPINMPEKKFIDAVLNYNKHNYYFFCAKDDFSGYHVFSKNFKEHKKNARKFQKALDKLKIFK
ncbi:MAG: aminodeoxychorismate lyase [Flammeovirgaceae bacterium]|nr:aminodeoxychorismate lyase [Flammeovirgaceae bacterium]